MGIFDTVNFWGSLDLVLNTHPWLMKDKWVRTSTGLKQLAGQPFMCAFFVGHYPRIGKTWWTEMESVSFLSFIQIDTPHRHPDKKL